MQLRPLVKVVLLVKFLEKIFVKKNVNMKVQLAFVKQIFAMDHLLY